MSAEEDRELEKQAEDVIRAHAVMADEMERNEEQGFAFQSLALRYAKVERLLREEKQKKGRNDE